MEESPEYGRVKAALVYDADNTLVQGYHPNLVLIRRGIDLEEFWRRVSEAQKFEESKGENTSLDILYLAYFMNEVRHGRLSGLSNEEMREIGREELSKILYPGLPGFFNIIKERNTHCDISNNIVSVGIKPVLEGSVLGSHMDNIFGYTFFDGITEGEEIDEVKSTSSSQEKTYAIDLISHGKFGEGSDFEYPIRYMTYIGDGETDRKAFKFMSRWGGAAVCVFNPENNYSYEYAKRFWKDVRGNIFPADYREGSELLSFLDSRLKSFE